MSTVLAWSLVDGWLPVVVTVFGATGGVWLLARRGRTWWQVVVPAVLVGALLVALLARLVVDEVWRPFPDALPLRVVFWVAVALAAAAFAVARLGRTTWPRRIGAVVAVLLVITLAEVKINAFYGEFPDVRSALGVRPSNEIDFAAMPAALADPVRPPADGVLEDNWRPAGALPAAGAVTRVPIPAVRSGFPATRDAYVYLPPAYWAANRPLLPVLMLVHGQPGGPVDWIDGGGLAGLMDAFASRHHGLAPVVVVPDATGSTLGNPLCMDSRLGNAESYLTQDVPEWVRAHVQVGARWAVAGYSYGGTCSLQLALRRPDLFPSFVDISGQQEPTLGTRERTVAAAFGGDETRFRQVNPLDLLASTRFPGSAGMLTVGADDRAYGAEARIVLEAVRRNGMDAGFAEVSGGHDWRAWAGGLRHCLDWLGSRMGVSR